MDMNIPFITTIQAARAAVRAIEETRGGDLDVKPLQAVREWPDSRQDSNSILFLPP